MEGVETTPRKPKLTSTRRNFVSPSKTKIDPSSWEPTEATSSILDNNNNNNDNNKKNDDIEEEEDVEKTIVIAKPKKKTEEDLIVARAKRYIHRQNSLAYGTPDSPIYGEITENSLKKIYERMELDGNSILCDVGSGTGSPSIYACCRYPGLVSYGFELMGSRWWISQIILQSMLKDPLTSEAASRVMLTHTDLSDLKDFGPCTHIFSFDTGFPASALESFAKAFNARGNQVKIFASFQKLEKLQGAGFKHLELYEKLSVKMSGSGEGKQIMFYRINNPHSSSSRISKKATSKKKKKDEMISSWDLPRLYPPPKNKRYASTVEHTESYAKGEDARLNGIDDYLLWIGDQIGLYRDDHTSSTTSKKISSSSSTNNSKSKNTTTTTTLRRSSRERKPIQRS